MESLKDKIYDIRSFLYGGVRAFPLTMAGTFLVLGLMTANYAMLFFLVGFLVIVPLLAKILNLGVDSILPLLGLGSWFKVQSSDVCGLKIPFVTTNSKNTTTPTAPVTAFSSVWVAMTAFFFGYLLTNAVALYNRPSMQEEIVVNTSSSPDIEAMQTNRTSQALIAIISIAVVTVIVILARVFLTGCESLWGALWTTLLFGNLGFGWYKALSSVGQDRLSDLFGIANRLLAPDAIANAPIACLPIKI